MCNYIFCMYMSSHDLIALTYGYELKATCMYAITAPSCYVTTDCIGEPINSSITYSDCCMNFGVSYDLDGRCQPCPSTSKYFHVFHSYY